jgi:hypothetical protein
MLATKDHFILLASSDKIGTELWSGYEEGASTQVTNAIGFLCRGSASAFRRSGNTWTSYANANSPLLLVRPHFGDFGIASKEASTKFGCILAKQQHQMSQIAELSNASAVERIAIVSTDKSVIVDEKCKFNELRDLNTFEVISEEDLSASDYIYDSDIEIEGNE